MHSQDWFETHLMIAAEEARNMGFVQTNLALLDVLRSARKVRAKQGKTHACKSTAPNQNWCNEDTLDQARL